MWDLLNVAEPLRTINTEKPRYSALTLPQVLTTKTGV